MKTGVRNRFCSAISQQKDWKRAAAELADKAKRGLEGGACSLGVFFISEGYEDMRPEELASSLSGALPGAALIGCNASGVIAAEREVEMEPAMSLLAMQLPEVKISPFSLSAGEIASLKGETDLVKLLDVYPSDKPSFLCLGDPMTCDADKLLGLFNAVYPGRPVIGGLASGGAQGLPNWLALGGEIMPDGAVGVALSGEIEFQTIVAQGCRPIGDPFIITQADRHILRGLGGKPALEVLRDLLESLPPEDKKLARHSLFAGLVMNESRPPFKRGDFLIRNLMGYDAESGALMVGAELKAGHTLQFQLRDAKTSAEDLKTLLEGAKGLDAQGAMLVSCCGRGRGLYGAPDHDLKLIQAALGPLPIAGFFANGELGPVGGVNYIHGYTSSLAIIK